jgi:hypothetical protein
MEKKKRGKDGNGEKAHHSKIANRNEVASGRDLGHSRMC